MRVRLIIWLVGAVLFSMRPAAALPDKAARCAGWIDHVHGEAWLAPAGSAPVKLTEARDRFRRLNDGDRLKCGAGGAVSAQLLFGKTMDVRGPCGWQKVTRPAPAADPRQQRLREAMERYGLMGGRERGPRDPKTGVPLGPRLPSPAGAVRPGPITLHWQGPVDDGGGAARLLVRVREADTGAVAFEQEAPASERALALPPDALAPSRWYVWSVSMVGGTGAPGSQQCGAPLRVLTASEARAVDKLIERVPAGSALLRGEVAEQFGLYDEAARLYAAALKAHPGDREAGAALKRVRSWVARPDAR